MNPVIRSLGFAAKHGRLLLVLGLCGGFLLPTIAQAMKPWLPWMVAFLIFTTALRIGPRAALGNLKDANSTFTAVLILQVVLPLVVLGGLAIFGWHGTIFGIAIVLSFAGSPISGVAAFTALMGRSPDRALRLLILGTVLLPLTLLPVLWLSPALGNAADVFWAAARLTLVLAVAIGSAFLVRSRAFPEPEPDTVKALDGLAALTLMVIVVGLMSAVGPAIRTDAASLLPWIALVFAVNIGQQIAARLTGADVATSVAAGNRNIALFLVAFPPDVIEPLLLFIGCYQIPMYLTPLVMKPFYDRV